MTEEEYLQSRIKEIECSVNKLFITEKHRNNQLNALKFYKNTLERLNIEKNYNN